MQLAGAERTPPVLPPRPRTVIKHERAVRRPLGPHLRRRGQGRKPEEDGTQDRDAVGRGEFVVPGGQAAPLLEAFQAVLDQTGLTLGFEPGCSPVCTLAGLS